MSFEFIGKDGDIPIFRCRECNEYVPDKGRFKHKCKRVIKYETKDKRKRTKIQEFYEKGQV